MAVRFFYFFIMAILTWWKCPKEKNGY